MNIETCKKCDKDCYIYLNRNNGKYLFSLDKVYALAFYDYIIYHHDIHNKVWWSSESEKDLDKNCFKHLTISKNCPFYMEHLLSDLNER